MKKKLDLYNKKRNFKITSEPKGIQAHSKSQLIFVVQEHHARQLHYDFRLEWKGVLKSWAVPKGPSMKPSVKRLAAETEDHPLAYGSFEGSIPQGEYGAGTVRIWDSGTWEPIGDAEQGLKLGRLEFNLTGKKLNGKFYLVKTNFKGNKTWLLIKAREKIKPVSNRTQSKFTSPDKIIYQKEKITKKEINDYYQAVAKFMVPHLKDKPISLVRCPRGTQDKCFYQKHPTPSAGEGIKVITIKDNDPTTLDEYLTVTTAKGLQDLVQINSTEIHTWNCFYRALMTPCQIVLDLDPAPDVEWSEVKKAALEIKDVLDKMKLKSFVKLTGGKGVHIHIPLSLIYSWDEAKRFSRQLAEIMVEKNPNKYLAQASKQKRKGKIFIDYLRNAYGATAVAPYSLRAKAESSVALPLSWDDLKKMKTPRLSMNQTLTRLKRRKQDPWAKIINIQQKLPQTETVPLFYSGEKPAKSGDDEFT